jgi:hypothetical protein|tara:strand:- start:3336 stop:3527 length:192 start_codon:yes stop_codon:yes gene_type:complete
MDQIKITCQDNGKIAEAEVLSQTDKYLKVVLIGTNLTLELFKNDPNKPYIGNKSGLEFFYKPE